jgi:putative oxidoreductase
MVSFSRRLDLALLVLRVFGGGLMAYHGWQKLDRGVGSMVPVLERINAPVPELLGPLVVGLELVGGILLVAGVLTTLWSAALAVQMLFTTWLFKADSGLIAPPGGGSGAEVDLLYFAVFAAILLLGPGRWSLDQALISARSRRVQPAFEGHTVTGAVKESSLTR